MKFARKVINAAEAAYAKLAEDENYIKGVDFEKYVISLFDPKYFKIHDWTRDNSAKLDRRVESDSNPDITMRYIKTKELFSIECKFRSQAFDNTIEWARPDQILNYTTYSLKNNIPTFVVIGLEGIPNSPERMFCIPIEEAKYPKLFMSFLKQFERPPDKNFFWKNKELK